MRLLIDGYNLMLAVVQPGRKLGPDGLRKVRRRFLNDLAARLDPTDLHLTTVVFDASNAPEGVRKVENHKGMTIIFAVEDDTADDRIEHLIARHSAPKNLTVVSSDRRLRQAAQRRKARVAKADDFWAEISDKARKRAMIATVLTAEETARSVGLEPKQADEWMAVFGHLDRAPETIEAFRHADFVPTDEEIARIEREVEREFPSEGRQAKAKKKRR